MGESETQMKTKTKNCRGRESREKAYAMRDAADSLKKLKRNHTCSQFPKKEEKHPEDS